MEKMSRCGVRKYKMKVIITVKDADNIIGLKEDISMRLEGVADILRIDTIDVAPNSDVAREIFKEIEKILDEKFSINHGVVLISKEDFAELKKKYTKGGEG